MKLHIDGKVFLLHVLETHVGILETVVNASVYMCSVNDTSMCTLNASQCDCFMSRNLAK